MILCILYAVDLNKISVNNLWKTYFRHSDILIKYLILYNNYLCEGCYIDYDNVDNLVGII